MRRHEIGEAMEKTGLIIAIFLAVLGFIWLLFETAVYCGNIWSSVVIGTFAFFTIGGAILQINC